MKAGWSIVALLLCRVEADPARHFVESVKLLLESRCISCHGPDKVKGGLRMDSREALLKGGDSGPALVPGKPADSLMLQAVLHTKKDLEMPPKEKLSARDIEVLERWVREGALWPETPVQIAAASSETGERMGDAWSDPRNPIVRIFGGERLDLWSLKPIARPALPVLRSGQTPAHPIDTFVRARLEQAGLKPSAEANRRTLARRLYFDLTGLPPSPQEMDQFLKDKAPGAYERLVERLLDSPRYGEHAARQWLDVVRYSDSNGFDWDEFRPKAWRFRDYSIRSFNADKPFDQFVREQLAGDELLDGPPKTEAERDLLIATGYLRLGPQDNSAPLFNEQARSRAELMADLVETTSSAFLGLTMSCCRCHDHKFDPLSQADHFRMRAFFEGVKHGDEIPLDLAPDQEAIRKHNAAVEEKIKPARDEQEKIVRALKDRIRAERIAKLSSEEQELLKSGKAEELEKKLAASDKDALAAATEEEKKQHEAAGKRIAELAKEKREFMRGLLMTDAEGAPPATRILYRGDHKPEREPAPPGFISALDPNPARIEKGPNSKTLGRRLALANWIASPQNPLTARVLANRLWQMHFGEPLVATPNDFGLAGARPSHPELLDYLASELIASGWSLKKMHRLIVTSAAYKQVSARPERSKPNLVLISAKPRQTPSEIDSENRLLWRQNLRRLSAEQLRDALLAVAGKLNEHAGGPPIWPELPSEILVANPAFLDDNAEKTKGWYPSPAPEQPVRSIFLVQKRTVRVPFMETFDLPENATSCARRTPSIVAPQALSLLNGPLALDTAKAFAERIKSGAEEPETQVRRAFALAFQRPPEAAELRACLALLKSRGLGELCRALLNANEFIYID